MAENCTTTVYLVGAGPGDPGLITMNGMNALRRADVVVYDYLANALLLGETPAGCERVYVGKSSNQHTMTQDQINAVLVQKAREVAARKSGGVVVRLKGGDPYVFGRGGEEGEFLRAHGVPFVEVPGITSGIAATAYAGIPVTHRDFTSSITLVTGHEKADADPNDPRVNYEALAKLNGTMVFYMGVKALPQTTTRLMAAGLSADTPAAVIRWGTHPHQRTVVGTVGTIVDAVTKAGLTAPAITVIGQVVTLRDTLNWFEQRPLFGQRVVVTRTRQHASELTTQLTALGAQVLEAPTIEIRPVADTRKADGLLSNLGTFHWIVFTSANGVEAAWQRVRALKKDARIFFGLRVGAIGPATAEALERIGIVPDLLPEKFVGEELAKALIETIGSEQMRGKRFLMLRADIARPVLREELKKCGASVEDVAIYETARPEKLPEDVLAAIDAGKVDWLTFTSASTAENLHALLSDAQREKVKAAKRLSIGPITSAALAKLGWPATVEAEQHDIGGMVAALAKIRPQQPVA